MRYAPSNATEQLKGGLTEDGNCRRSLVRNFLQDGGVDYIYRNGNEGSNPACSSRESNELRFCGVTVPSNEHCPVACPQKALATTPRCRLSASVVARFWFDFPA
jgi:hypothetical protein